jgi:hypothetical protein
MFELPRELIVWMKTGLSVFLLACVYLLSVATIVLFAAIVLFRGFLKYKRPQPVICPSTGASVELRIAPLRAAIANLFGEREFRILSCSRTKSLNECDQTCLTQIT